MFKKLFLISLCLSAFACGGMEYDVEESEYETEDALINNGGLGVEGGACHVVAGPNSGKSGTYDDGFCCDEGPSGWGCTECSAGGVDNGKCKDGAKVTRPTRPVIVGGGGVLTRGN